MKKLLSLFAVVLISTATFSEAKAADLTQEFIERLSISGLIEVEAGYESVDELTGGSTDSSDIVLATAQLGFGFSASETISGDLIFLYEEEPGSQVEVDEATINFDDGKYFARLGRQYVPFGVFVSNFISDPLVLELGETQATALLGGTRIGPAELSLFAFNGDADKAGDEDQIDDFGASLMVTAGEMLEFGASYMSDLAESGAELTLDAVTVDERIYTERSAGWSAYFVATFEPVVVSAEVLAAADKLDDLGVDLDEPLAWNAEVALAVDESVTLALKIEGSDEISGTPEIQYGACLAKGIGDNLSLAFEYLHGEFDEAINAPLDTRDVVTAQLALEF